MHNVVEVYDAYGLVGKGWFDHRCGCVLLVPAVCQRHQDGPLRRADARWWKLACVGLACRISGISP